MSVAAPEAVAATAPVATPVVGPAGRWAARALPWAWLALPFLGLGALPLLDVDEGAFAEAAREMVASGDWLHTTLNGTDRFDKPIGVYWLQAASIKLFGTSEWAVRLPSALSLALMAWACARFVARHAGSEMRPHAWLAAGMLVTSLGFGVIGRAATADALLNLLLALTFFELARWLCGEQPDRHALLRAYLCCGLGLLVKGPVALVIPTAVLLLWCAAQRSAAPLLRALAEWRGLLLLAAVALPWYAYALARHGWAFVDGFILRHNVERFTATLEGHGGSLAYYLVLLPLLWLPWSPLLWTVLASLRRLWAEPLMRLALLWVGFVLGFFSLSGTKLPHYVLYGAAPLVLLLLRAAALLTASGRDGQGIPGRIQRGLLVLGFGLWLALLLGLPWLLPGIARGTTDPLYRALLSDMAPASELGLILALIGALALGIMAGFGLRRTLAPTVVLTFALAGQALLALWTAPWLGEALGGPIKRAAQAAQAAQAARAPAPDGARSTPPRIVQWQVDWPSVAYTLEQPVPRRAPQPGELALTRIDRVPHDAPVVWLYRERGVGLLRWQGSTP